MANHVVADLLVANFLIIEHFSPCEHIIITQPFFCSVTWQHKSGTLFINIIDSYNCINIS